MAQQANKSSNTTTILANQRLPMIMIDHHRQNSSYIPCEAKDLLLTKVSQALLAP